MMKEWEMRFNTSNSEIIVRRKVNKYLMVYLHFIKGNKISYTLSPINSNGCVIGKRLITRDFNKDLNFEEALSLLEKRIETCCVISKGNAVSIDWNGSLSCINVLYSDGDSYSSELFSSYYGGIETTIELRTKRGATKPYILLVNGEEMPLKA